MKTECALCMGIGSYGYYSTDGEGNDIFVDELCEDCEGTGFIDGEESHDTPD